MAYFPGQLENQPEEGAAIVFAGAAITREAERLGSRAILLASATDIRFLSINPGEVAMALAAKLRIPRSELRVTRHHPEHFLALFAFEPQRDSAIQATSVRVRGIDFDILPWTPTQHGRDVTWWYRVRVAIENLPLHAWNELVARSLLGDDCPFDRIELSTSR